MRVQLPSTRVKRHSCDPSAGEAGTGRSLGLAGQTIQWGWWSLRMKRKTLPSLWRTNRLAYEHLDARHIHKAYIHMYVCIYLRAIKNWGNSSGETYLSCVFLFYSNVTLKVVLQSLWHLSPEGVDGQRDCNPLVLTVNTHALPNQRQGFGYMWWGLFNNHPCSINEVTLAEKKP